MPTALQFVTFTPSEEYITNERTFEDFASWIVPASRGTFLDGQALHGTRVDDENVAHILFHASSVHDLHELGKDEAFEVEAYHRILTLVKVKDPLSMSLLYVEFEDDWETIRPLLHAPFTEISTITAPDAESFAKAKETHISELTKPKGSSGNTVFGTVVQGAENMSFAIGAWKAESHSRDAFNNAAEAIDVKAVMFRLAFVASP